MEIALYDAAWDDIGPDKVERSRDPVVTSTPYLAKLRNTEAEKEKGK